MFIAPVDLAEGTKLINCFFFCNEYEPWEESWIGPGSSMVGGYAECVNAENSGTWANVTEGIDASGPDCVDCSPQTNVSGPAGTQTGGVVVTRHGTITQPCGCGRKRLGP